MLNSGAGLRPLGTVVVGGDSVGGNAGSPFVAHKGLARCGRCPAGPQESLAGGKQVHQNLRRIRSSLTFCWLPWLCLSWMVEWGGVGRIVCLCSMLICLCSFV